MDQLSVPVEFTSCPDSLGTPVFYIKYLHEIRQASPPTEAPNAGVVGQNRQLLANNRL